MKFLASLSVFGLIASVIASPVAAPAPAVEKRQYDSEVSLLTDLYNNIQTYTGTINSTVLNLPAGADPATIAAAETTVNDAVTQITNLITAAAGQVGTVAATRMRSRQDSSATAVVGLLGQILSELSGALNNVLASLGLGSLLGLGGLTNALSQLIAALKVVVDDLLILVKQLLDGILTGLSLALAGITF